MDWFTSLVIRFGFVALITIVIGLIILDLIFAVLKGKSEKENAKKSK